MRLHHIRRWLLEALDCGKFPYPEVRFQKDLIFERPGSRKAYIMILDWAITTCRDFFIQFKKEEAEMFRCLNICLGFNSHWITHKAKRKYSV